MKSLSRRALQELNMLQAAMRELASSRNEALRHYMTSRGVATDEAQREFWLEFSWIDQEYRIAVRRIAQFCLSHGANRSSVRSDRRPIHAAKTLAMETRGAGCR